MPASPEELSNVFKLSNRIRPKGVLQFENRILEFCIRFVVVIAALLLFGFMIEHIIMVAAVCFVATSLYRPHAMLGLSVWAFGFLVVYLVATLS